MYRTGFWGVIINNGGNAIKITRTKKCCSDEDTRHECVESVLKKMKSQADQPSRFFRDSPGLGHSVPVPESRTLSSRRPNVPV